MRTDPPVGKVAAVLIRWPVAITGMGGDIGGIQLARRAFCGTGWCRPVQRLGDRNLGRRGVHPFPVAIKLAAQRVDARRNPTSCGYGSPFRAGVCRDGTQRRQVGAVTVQDVDAGEPLRVQALQDVMRQRREQVAADTDTVPGKPVLNGAGV